MQDKKFVQLEMKMLYAVKQSKLKSIVGCILLLINAVVFFLGYLNTTTLIITLTLLLVTLNQIADYRIDKSVLNLVQSIKKGYEDEV